MNDVVACFVTNTKTQRDNRSDGSQVYRLNITELNADQLSRQLDVGGTLHTPHYPLADATPQGYFELRIKRVEKGHDPVIRTFRGTLNEFRNSQFRSVESYLNGPQNVEGTLGNKGLARALRTARSTICKRGE